MRTTIGDILGPNFVYTAESTALRITVATPEVDDAFLEARRQARTWITDICQRFDLEARFDTTAPIENERCRVETIGTPKRFTVALRHVDRHTSDRFWMTDLDLRADGDRAVCDVRYRTAYPSNAARIDLHPPRLLAMLQSAPGLHDVEALSDTPQRVQASEVEQLVRLAAAPARRLPIVLVSPPLNVDVARLARELAGAAHVRLLDEEATWKITERFGKERSCYLGAVRVIPNGEAFESDPRKTRLLLAGSLQRLADKEGAEAAIRRGVLADITAAFESASLETVGSLRSARAAQELVRSEPTALVPDHTSFATIPSDATIDSLRQELQNLRERLDGAQRDLADSQQEAQRARQEAATARKEAEDAYALAAEEEAKGREAESELTQLRASSLGISVADLPPAQQELLRHAFTTVIQLRDALIANDVLRTDHDQLRNEYDDMRERCYRLSQQSATLRANPDVSSDPAEQTRPDWNDFEALQRHLTLRYQGNLVVHPRVKARLTEGHLTNPDALFEILDILGTTFLETKRGAPGARERLMERTKPYKVGKALTNSGAGLVGERYACEFEGVRYSAQEHLHIRENGTDFEGRHACVYYVYDDRRDRVIVTSMPRHLDTTNAHT